MTPLLTFRRDSRPPTAWVGAGVCALMTALALKTGGPIYYWAVWLFPLGMFLRMITLPKRTGLWLDEDALVLSPEAEAQRLTLKDIEEVTLEEEHGRLIVTIFFLNGRVEQIRADQSPTADNLTPILKRAGIPVHAAPGAIAA